MGATKGVMTLVIFHRKSYRYRRTYNKIPVKQESVMEQTYTGTCACITCS